ncbi:MAG: FliM/FliN family flagellar motor switch protein [Terriglobales bacterium]|jgi:flagellar motor switch protein FliM|nr:flagellar motor switch protein FliM [Terriglobales bacterium]
METINQTAMSPARGAVLASGSVAPEQVQACNFRTVGGIDQARLAPLLAACEGFARTFSQTVQGKLGLTCEITLQSSEQMPCPVFVEKAGSSYIVSLQLGPQGELALLQIDPVLLFPIVDRLLGGSGGPSELAREVTEIEDHIAQDFVRLICHDLEIAWRAFNVSASTGMRQMPGQLQKMFSAKDNALVFSFAANLQAAGGGFQLMLPIASLAAFLGANTISAQEVHRKGAMSNKLAEQALGWTFGLELALSGGKVNANDLLNLSVGKVLPLGVPVQTPAVLKIGGYESFAALPVRSGRHRGAQLLGRLPQPQETENVQ